MTPNSNAIILPTTQDNTSFRIVIETQDAAYFAWLTTPNYPLCKEMSVNISWNLKHLLKNEFSDIETIIQDARDITSFAESLSKLIERHSVLHKDANKSVTYALETCTDLLASIDAVGWDRVSQISEDFSNVTLFTEDENSRIHYMTVEFSGSQQPRVTVDLPEDFEVDLSAGRNFSLVEAFREFRSRVEKYQKFWSAMDGFDSVAAVLEPENPTRKDIRRKIMISSNAYALLTVNPNYPELFPDIQWIGAETAVEPLRAKLVLSIDGWDQSLSLFQNLESLLEIELPVKTSTSSPTSEISCGICYATRLEDEYPSHSCDNCKQSYHHRCLYDWLHGLSTAKVLRNLVFGECPYCSMSIHCKQPD